jgi:hypothetical protein
MDVEAALAVADALIFAKTGKHLSTLQTAIFRGAWSGQKYEQIAETSYCSDTYVKMVGSELWELISQGLEQRVSKKNFRAALELRGRLPAPSTVNISLAAVSSPQIQEKFSPHQTLANGSLPAPQQQPCSLEFPSSSVPLNSLFYIERPPIEERTYAQISKPGSLIRIKAPKQMGKTSLMHRILARARQTGLRTVLLSLHQADSRVFTSLDKFLRWLCANVSQQLNLEPKLDEYWDEDIGSKVSCTLYFQGYVLAEIDSAIVLALDEVNRIFEYPEISSDFLPLLRSWYEDASELESWQKLRLVVVHATEAYIPLDINQSPFNVGLPIQLPEFSYEQVQELAVRHGLDWAKGEAGAQKLAPLLAMVGGHPYLVRVALYHLGRQEVTLEQLLQEAPTLAGIYSNHLRCHLANLQEHPKLAAALKQVITAPKSVQLEAIAAYKLESMGLVKLEGNQATPSCELYRLYFREQLG